MRHGKRFLAVTLAVGTVIGILYEKPAIGHELPVGYYYSYRRTQTVEKDRTYNVTIDNLTKRDYFQWSAAIPQIFVFDGTSHKVIVNSPRNYDFNGQSISVNFKATWESSQSTRTYTILVTALSENRCGRGDLSFKDNTTGLGWEEPQIPFCATIGWTDYYAGECFYTRKNSMPTDTYIFLIHGNNIDWDDDGGTGYRNSRLCVDEDGGGQLILTSWSSSTEGGGKLDLAIHSYVQDKETGSYLGGIIYDDWSYENFYYVYRDWRTLNAGTIYTIGTEDLHGRFFMQSNPPDTYLYIVDPDTQAVIARNDDYGGTLRSQVSFIPGQTKTYAILVRSYNTYRQGTFDLVINGERVVNDATFGGLRLKSHLKANDCVSTYRQSGDPYLYWMPWTSTERVVMNDDGAGNLNSKICFADLMDAEGRSVIDGYMFLGSYRSYGSLGEGQARVNLYGGSWH